MENIEVIIAWIGLGGAVFGGAGVAVVSWLLNRKKYKSEVKKSDAEITDLINKTAGDLVENVRKELHEMQDRLDKVEENNNALITILHKWAAGIQKLIEQIKELGHLPCWIPDPDDLKKVE